MAYLLFDNFRQFTADSGALLTGGFLRFTDPLTTLDKTVYADSGLTTPLGAQVTLDAAAKSATAIWVSGQVNVELLDADEVQVGLCEEMGEPTVGGITLPDPSTGDDDDVLSIAGGVYVLRPVREVPDPSGHVGKYVGTDGELIQWTAFPATEDYSADNLPGGIESGTDSYRIGDTLIQRGSSSMAATNALTGNKAVTFTTAYDTAPKVDIMLTGSGGHTPQGAKVGWSVVATTGGFTVYFYAADEHDTPGWLITNAVAFDWRAEGISAP